MRRRAVYREGPVLLEVLARLGPHTAPYLVPRRVESRKQVAEVAQALSQPPGVNDGHLLTHNAFAESRGDPAPPYCRGIPSLLLL